MQDLLLDATAVAATAHNNSPEASAIIYRTINIPPPVLVWRALIMYLMKGLPLYAYVHMYEFMHAHARTRHTHMLAKLVYDL